MYQYTCPICHRPSYSATDPAHAYSDKCPYEGCDGHVVPVEPVKKRVIVINLNERRMPNGQAHS